MQPGVGGFHPGGQQVHTLPHGIPPPPESFEDFFGAPPPPQQQQQQGKPKFRRSESFTGGRGGSRAGSASMDHSSGRGSSRARQASGGTQGGGGGQQSRSQSPLSVVRAKRASQAQWEKQQKLKNQQDPVVGSATPTPAVQIKTASGGVADLDMGGIKGEIWSTESRCTVR